MKTGKVWGDSRLELQTLYVAVHAIEVKSGGYCSWHSHKTKWNAFRVLSGTLVIQVRREHGLTDETYLEPGDITTIKPGEVHRFYNRRGVCHALEIYHTNGNLLDPDDIDRLSHGGVYDVATLTGPPEDAA